MDSLKKMEMLKKKKEMSPVEKEAKMSIMKDIQDMASKAMGDKLGGLKKVTVASDSPSGLKEGLEKAEDMLEAKEETEMPEMMDDSEMEDEMSMDEDMSMEEIDQKLQELLDKKKALESKKM